VRDAAGLNGLADTSIVPTGCVRWPLATEARAPWCSRPEKPAIDGLLPKGHFLPNGLGANRVEVPTCDSAEGETEATLL